MLSGQLPGRTEDGAEGIFTTCDHVLRGWPDEIPAGWPSRDNSKKLWCFGCHALLPSPFGESERQTPLSKMV